MTDNMLKDTPAILAFGNDFTDTPQRLRERFLEIYQTPMVVMDLSGVDTIDPAFLSELAQLHVHRRQLGLMLGRLVVDSHGVRNALRAVGFDRHWPIYATLEEALASFEGPELID